MRTEISFLCFFCYASVCTLSCFAENYHHFSTCISKKFQSANDTSEVIYTPQSSSYLSVLDFTATNPRFTTPQTPRPLLIITPERHSHIKYAILCSKKYGIQIRIRSGGHDFEGLSYVFQVPFALIDMRNFRSIKVNAKDATAWVGTAATIGEIYYKIANKSKTLAFPAGTCPSVGAGGHISGGGIGMLVRKYGLSADHVIDARLIDVNGKVLDRKSMGEVLFWAIRGGGGASFGVILAFKLKLVYVPPKVTVFTVQRTLEQNGSNLVYQWQSIASNIDINLSWRVFLRSAINSQDGKRTVQASFVGLYLGKIDSLVPLMDTRFHQLGLEVKDCQEMSWIESGQYFYTGKVEDFLSSRYTYNFVNFKLKSDFVKKPIPRKAFGGIWKLFNQEELGVPMMVLTALGGRMSQIPASELPFPHRGGNLYLCEYQGLWFGQDSSVTTKHVDWTRKLHRYLTPYVSKSPRQAYLKYRDLDLGVNNVENNTSYAKAKIWGEPYYGGHFRRLAHVKSLVDPSNFFKFELSIPLIHS